MATFENVGVELLAYQRRNPQSVETCHNHQLTLSLLADVHQLLVKENTLVIWDLIWQGKVVCVDRSLKLSSGDNGVFLDLEVAFG